MKTHWIFNGETQRLKGYSFITDNRVKPEPNCVFNAECHNAAVEAGFGTDGKCPAGSYTLGAVEYTDGAHELEEMGDYFIPVLNVPGRDGIGIHGGGSGLANPLASQQGWVETLGCFRLQNEDLAQFQKLVTEGDRFDVELNGQLANYIGEPLQSKAGLRVTKG